MTVREIIEKYLEDNKLDGLFSDGGECACEKGDLFPCGEPFEDCEPGIKKNCTEDCVHEGLEAGWHIERVEIEKAKEE